jgi:hypothetical protein
VPSGNIWNAIWTCGPLPLNSPSPPVWLSATRLTGPIASGGVSRSSQILGYGWITLIPDSSTGGLAVVCTEIFCDCGVSLRPVAPRLIVA